MKRNVLCIVGPHGSGKSTLAKKLFGATPTLCEAECVVGGVPEKLNYVLSSDKQLAIVGKYPIDGTIYERGGGCDGVGNMAKVEATVNFCCSLVPWVLYEGIMLRSMRSMQRLELLYGVWPTIVHLNFDLDFCLESVMHRRKVAGNFKPLDPKNVFDSVWANKSFAKRAKVAGYDIHQFTDRDEVLTFVQGKIYDTAEHSGLL